MKLKYILLMFGASLMIFTSCAQNQSQGGKAQSISDSSHNSPTNQEARSENVKMSLDNQEKDKLPSDAKTTATPDKKKAEEHWNTAMAYSREGNEDAAIKEYTKAIELDPQYLWAYHNRALSYSLTGNHDAAIKDFSKIIELDPKFPEVYKKRGDEYADKKDYDSAIKDYTKAIEIEPKNAEAYSYRGSLYLDKTKNYDDAVKDFTKVIELKPDLVWAYENRAKAYEALGEKDLAEADRTKAKELRDK